MDPRALSATARACRLRVLQHVAHDLLGTLGHHVGLGGAFCGGAEIEHHADAEPGERLYAGDAEALVEDLYRRIQLPPSWVSRLTGELEAEIVERQAEASERRVVLTKTLAKLADERGKLLQAFYANAIPLDLLKTEQDRIGAAEHAAKDELQATEGDLKGWQDILRTAIRLAGNCHAAYLKARPSVRRRFNDAVLEAVYIRDRTIDRTEFSEVFAPLFSRPSSNKALKVDPRGFEPLTFWLPARRSTS